MLQLLMGGPVLAANCTLVTQCILLIQSTELSIHFLPEDHNTATIISEALEEYYKNETLAAANLLS